MLTQNVIFVGAVVEESARKLHAGLAARGWTVGELEGDWDDGPWTLPCARGQARLELVVAPAAGWYAMIYPADVPGLLRRLLGRTPSATPADVYALAVDVHALLLEGGFTQFHWKWEGFPEAGDPEAPPPVPLPTAPPS